MLDRARPYIPMVDAQIRKFWPTLPMHTFLFAQIEQESLWNPFAKLETKRELGRGFGQLTITSRFNAYEEVKGLEPALRDWDYKSDPFNPEKQVIAMLAKNRLNYRTCVQMLDGENEQMGCTGVAYNGGLGGFLSDRRVCSNTSGCNPRLWFGHIEHTSLKQKTAQAGYGKSFFEINREYAVNVVFKRRVKYELWE
jgi:hypothetical protein